MEDNLKKAAAGSSEISVHLQQPTRRHVPGYNILHSYRHDNLKFHLRMCSLTDSNANLKKTAEEQSCTTKIDICRKIKIKNLNIGHIPKGFCPTELQ